MITLWDLLPKRERSKPSVKTLSPAKRQPPRRSRAGGPAPGSMADRYATMTRTMLERHGIRVRKWRSGMTGVAWQVTYRDGSVARLIEAPRPKGPMSAAVFLHEIGHHAIGFDRYKLRCLEEYHAWAYSLAQMEAWNLNITDGVRRRMHESLWYAIQKAQRRGLKALPPELEPFAATPARFVAARR